MNNSWTPTARINYFEVLDHLAENPYIFEATRKSKNIRKGFVIKQSVPLGDSLITRYIGFMSSIRSVVTSPF